MKKLALLALLLFSTTGCYSLLGIDADSKTYYNQNIETYDINEPNQQLAEIDIYFGVNAKPETDYVQLAYLEASGNEGIGIKELIKTLREEALKKGADAVMEIDKKTVTQITSSTSELGYKANSYKVIVLTGIAIKYIEGPINSSEN